MVIAVSINEGFEAIGVMPVADGSGGAGVTPSDKLDDAPEARTIPDLATLIVDDEPFILDVVEALLSELGITDIRRALSGSEAREIVANGGIEIDLILLDLLMPDRDGIETIGDLNNAGYTGQICIVTNAPESLTNAAKALGDQLGLNIVDTLRKPATIEKLRDLFLSLDGPGDAT